MKTKLVAFAFCLFYSSGFAQKAKVSESLEKIANGIHPALVIFISECNPADVEKEWKSKMKAYKYDKLSSRNGVVAEDIVIPEISSQAITVYSSTEKIKENTTKLIVAFDMGGGFLSSDYNPNGYNAAQLMLQNFAQQLTENALIESLRLAEKSLDKLKEQQKELEEHNDDLRKDIENYKSKIKKAEEDLISNKTDQEKKKAEIETQLKVVDEYSLKAKNHK